MTHLVLLVILLLLDHHHLSLGLGVGLLLLNLRQGSGSSGVIALCAVLAAAARPAAQLGECATPLWRGHLAAAASLTFTSTLTFLQWGCSGWVWHHRSAGRKQGGAAVNHVAATGQQRCFPSWQRSSHTAQALTNLQMKFIYRLPSLPSKVRSLRFWMLRGGKRKAADRHVQACIPVSVTFDCLFAV